MADLIARAALYEKIQPVDFLYGHDEDAPYSGMAVAACDIEDAAAIDAVELPCKIGDRVWAIRSYKGIKHPQEGIVSEMFFTNDMQLMIVVKNVARGTWGKTVFSSYKEADNAIEETKK